MGLRLLLLDRNVVNAVKRCVAGCYLESNKRSFIRGLDKSRNIISPILSVIEGQSGERESEEAIKDTLKKETAAVRGYFKQARTDSNFFLSDEEKNHFAEV